jgi:hypothetical protein
MNIPNPVEAAATGLRVAMGISLDVASYGVAKVFPKVREKAPETTPAAGANLYEVADAMLDGKLIYHPYITANCWLYSCL